MATLEENAVVGSYRIIRKLGQGGMGAVYEALHQTLGRHVAIKVLHPEVARNEEFAMRFANEARAANIVDHPDVVQITDHGTLPDGIPYIVMEYLKGESLGHRIEHLGGPMGASEVAFIALQIADVLAAAHARGIIHRDLKPPPVPSRNENRREQGKGCEKSLERSDEFQQKARSFLRKSSGPSGTRMSLWRTRLGTKSATLICSTVEYPGGGRLAWRSITQASAFGSASPRFALR